MICAANDCTVNSLSVCSQNTRATELCEKFIAIQSKVMYIAKGGLLFIYWYAT